MLRTLSNEVVVAILGVILDWRVDGAGVDYIIRLVKSGCTSSIPMLGDFPFGLRAVGRFGA